MVATKVQTFVTRVGANQAKDFFPTRIAEVVTAILVQYELAMQFP